MTQQPGPPLEEPAEGRSASGAPPVPGGAVPQAPGTPPASAPQPAPQWGQYAPQWGQYAPPQQWGQPTQPPVQPPVLPPVLPPYGQYVPPAAPPAQQQWGQQPAWGQAPQWGQYGPPSTGYPVPGQANGANGPGHYVAPPKPGVIPLRPLGLGEVLDGAFQAARRNGKAMFGSALLVQAASALLSAILLTVFLSGGALASLMAGTTSRDALGSMVVGLGGGLLVTVLLGSMAQMVLQGALVVPVLRAILNRHTGFKSMWSMARHRIGTLVLVGLLTTGAVLVATAVVAAVAVLMVSAVGPGGAVLAVLVALAVLALFVWLGTKIMLAPAAVIVENLGVFPALARSWRLTTGHWWRTFGTYFVAALIAGIIAGVISTPVGFITGIVSAMITPNPTEADAVMQLVVSQGISMIVSTLIGAVTLAFQSGVLALIYVDLRMRKEGFDVVLMREMETTGPDTPGIPGASGQPVSPGAAGGPFPGPAPTL